MEIMAAHNQWAKRPDDEKFFSIQALLDATTAYAVDAHERLVPLSEIRTENQDGDIWLTRGQTPARISYKAFGQFAGLVGAPASYLRQLPATLAVQNLNHGLARRTAAEDQDVNLLLHQGNGSLLVRAATSEKYTRIWHWEIAKRLLALVEKGWELPGMFHGRSTGSPEDTVPSYFGQGTPELFSFLCKVERQLKAPGGRTLTRGVIYANDEVGGSSIYRLTFLYDYVCCNHIIWGAEEVKEIRLRHVGKVRERLEQFEVGLKAYEDGAASLDEAKITRAANYQIAETREKVLDKLFELDEPALSRKTLAAAYDAQVEAGEPYGSPRSAWGMVNGLTQISQKEERVEARVEIDRAAEKVLALSF